MADDSMQDEPSWHECLDGTEEALAEDEGDDDPEPILWVTAMDDDDDDEQTDAVDVPMQPADETEPLEEEFFDAVDACTEDAEVVILDDNCQDGPLAYEAAEAEAAPEAADLGTDADNDEVVVVAVVEKPPQTFGAQRHQPKAGSLAAARAQALSWRPDAAPARAAPAEATSPPAQPARQAVGGWVAPPDSAAPPARPGLQAAGARAAPQATSAPPARQAGGGRAAPPAGSAPLQRGQQAAAPPQGIGGAPGQQMRQAAGGRTALPAGAAPLRPGRQVAAPPQDSGAPGQSAGQEAGRRAAPPAGAAPPSAGVPARAAGAAAPAADAQPLPARAQLGPPRNGQAPAASSAPSRPGHKVGSAVASEKAVAPLDSGGDDQGEGFLFVGSDMHFSQSLEHQLFGAPAWQIKTLRQKITPDTPLFFFNYDTNMLYGTFVASGEVGLNVVPTAFGGQLGAQVPVSLLQSTVTEAKMPKRLQAGSKSSAELASLRAALEQSGPAPAAVREAWGADAPAEEPPPKRPRLHGPAGQPHAAGGQVAAASRPSRRVHAAQEAGVAPAPAASTRSRPPAPAAPKAPTKAPQVPAPSAASAPARTPGPAGARWEDLPCTENGYVVHCTAATELEVVRRHLFGMWEKDLPRMKQHINRGTSLYLLNSESLVMYGPFRAVAAPELDVVRESFQGRLRAQVRVAIKGSVLQQVQLAGRLPAGPRSQQELAAEIKPIFKSGSTAAPPEVHDAWAAPADDAPRPPAAPRRAALGGPPRGSSTPPWRPAGPRPPAHPPPGAAGPVPQGPQAMRGPPGAPRPPAPWRPVGVQNAPWRAPLAAGRPGSAGPTTDPARGGEHLSHVDSEGRPYNLNQIVVNFANVGAYFAKTVLKRDNRRGDRLFDWEGVRRCVKHLSDERSLKVVGVVYQNIDGPDNGVKVWDTPHDIKQMCQSIQQTPRLTGKNQRSADDEQTIKCAYRRNCRFMDNDNYREWLVEMRDEKCRNWLVEKQEMLQTRYFFDSELGTFDTLDGNIPMALLDRNNVNSMKMPIPAHLVGKC